MEVSPRPFVSSSSCSVLPVLDWFLVSDASSCGSRADLLDGSVRGRQYTNVVYSQCVNSCALSCSACSLAIYGISRIRRHCTDSEFLLRER